MKTEKDVKTSITTATELSHKVYNMTDSEIKESGLWPTGYSSSGKLLKANGNETDGHWSIICSSGWRRGTELDSNQWAYDSSNAVRKLPKCHNPISMTNKYQAVTIFQNSRAVGKYACGGVGAHIIGDVGFCPWGDVDGPWKKPVDNARWIGLNYYGLHTDDRSGRDPSIGASTSPACGSDIAERIYNCGNMYVSVLDRKSVV